MGKVKWAPGGVSMHSSDDWIGVALVDAAGRAFLAETSGAKGWTLRRLPDPPPIEEETPTPRQPLTEWPGPGEEPPGLWVLERSKIVGKLRGRFVLVPDSNRALWACSGYSLRSGDFEPGDRFIPVEV